MASLFKSPPSRPPEDAPADGAAGGGARAGYVPGWSETMRAVPAAGPESGVSVPPPSPGVAALAAADGGAMDEPDLTNPKVGDHVAGRFVLEKCLGAGGFGAVFRAVDVATGEVVAIKIASSDSPEEAARLLREARAAAKARSFHVVGVRDVYPHGPHLVMAMDYLEGATLAAHIEGKALTPDLVVRVAREACDGLMAIHATGIVHRDLKPANIMISNGHAVIMDFGISKPQGRGPGALNRSSDGAGHSHDDAIVGTPPYMALELLGGAPATPATDLFALGLILYEMITGELPGGDLEPHQIGKLIDLRRRPLPKLSDATRALYPPGFIDAVLKCAAPEAEDRFQTVEAFLQSWGETGRLPPRRSVAAAPTPASKSPPPPSGAGANATRTVHLARGPSSLPKSAWWRPLRRGAVVVMPVLGAALVLVGARVALHLRGAVPATQARPAAAVHAPPPAPSTRASAIVLPRTVAVLGLASEGTEGDREWLAASLAEHVSHVLGAEGGHALSRDAVARMKRDLKLQDVEDVSAEARAKIANYGVGGSLVTGAVRQSGGRVAVTLLVRDVVSGEEQGRVTSTGTVEGALAVAEQAALALRTSLRLSPLGPDDVEAVRRLLPKDRGAQRAYAEGLARLRSHEPWRAKSRLEAALAAAPECATLYATLGEVEAALGDEGAARRRWAAAAERAKGLPTAELMAIEAGNLDAAGKSAEAALTYAPAYEADSTDVSKGLRYARYLRRGNRLDEALSVLTELRGLPPPLGEDPEVLLEMATVKNLEGAAAEELELSKAALKGAKARSSFELLAEAGVHGASAKWSLGKSGEALDQLVSAASAYRATNNPLGELRVSLMTGAALEDQGRLGEAQRTYQLAAEFAAKAGSSRYEAMLEAMASQVALARGALDEATIHIEAARGTATPDAATRGVVLIVSAAVASAKSMHRDALQFARAAMETARDGGRPNVLANLLGDASRVHGAADEVAEAIGLAREAIHLVDATGDTSLEAPAYFALGSALLRRGEYLSAAIAFERAGGLVGDSLDARNQNAVATALARAQARQLERVRSDLAENEERWLRSERAYTRLTARAIRAILSQDDLALRTIEGEARTAGVIDLIGAIEPRR